MDNNDTKCWLDQILWTPFKRITECRSSCFCRILVIVSFLIGEAHFGRGLPTEHQTNRIGHKTNEDCDEIHDWGAVMVDHLTVEELEEIWAFSSFTASVGWTLNHRYSFSHEHMFIHSFIHLTINSFTCHLHFMGMCFGADACGQASQKLEFQLAELGSSSYNSTAENKFKTKTNKKPRWNPLKSQDQLKR